MRDHELARPGPPAALTYSAAIGAGGPMSHAILARLAWQSRPSWRLACLWTVLITALAVPLANGMVPSTPPAILQGDDSHQIVSFRMAMNWNLCGSYSHTTDGSEVDRILFSAGGLDVPILSLPSRAGLDRDTYCSTLVRPYRINENSLMLTMAALLWTRPESTLRDLGSLLHWFRVLALAGVVTVVLRAGASWLFALLWMVGALVILASVETTHYFSVYPFLMPMLLASAALAAWLADVGLESCARWGLLASAGVGFILGYVVNLRTSYAPILVALVAAIPFSWPHLQRGVSRKALVLAVGTLAGFLLFQRAFISPIDKMPFEGNLTYHHVFHPLVLSLAVPPNEFATREGIRWDDSVGVELARREKPEVKALSDDYERTMRDYYFRLWRTRPGEMMRLYFSKWSLTMSDVLVYDKTPFPVRLISFAGLPMRPVSNGIVFSVFLVAVIAFARLARGRWNRTAAALSIGFGVVGLLLVAEAAIIVPDFRMMYGAPRMVLMVTFGLCVWQCALNGVVSTLTRPRT